MECYCGIVCYYEGANRTPILSKKFENACHKNNTPFNFNLWEEVHCNSQQNEIFKLLFTSLVSDLTINRLIFHSNTFLIVRIILYCISR